MLFSTHDMDVAERMCDTIFMIYRGKKVLDGTLHSIQAKYGEDTIRVRTEGRDGVMENLPGVLRVNDYGHLQELRIAPGTDSQAVLMELARRRGSSISKSPGRRCTIFSSASPGRRKTAKNEGSMRKIVTIARREYQALVRTKAFVISLVVMPIFMCGAIFVQMFLQGRVDTSEKTIVVLDGTGRMLAPLQALAQLRNGEGAAEQGKKSRRTVKIEAGPPGPVTDDVRLKLSEHIRRDEIFAFLEIDADALKPSDNSPLLQLLRKIGVVNPSSETPPAEKTPPDEPSANSQPAATGHDVPVHLYMQSITYNEIGQWLMQSVNQAAFALRLEDAGLNPAAVAAAACPVDYQELGPYTRTTGGEIRKGDSGHAASISSFPSHW